jgi:hypothetical protein
MGYWSDNSDDSVKVELTWLDAKPDEKETTKGTKAGGEEPNWLNDYKVRRKRETKNGPQGPWGIQGLSRILQQCPLPQ